MFSKWFPKPSGQKYPSDVQNTVTTSQLPSRPLPYNWIKTGILAIGPIPKSQSHWDQLENDGFKKRFSCCYPNEHIYTPIPEDWTTKEVSLPDHRFQDDLQADQLIYALDEAHAMVCETSGPVYLHCFAGQQRSVLIAIGLVCRLDNMNLFDSLNYVRQCHKSARPMYSHLDLLERILADKI